MLFYQAFTLLVYNSFGLLEITLLKNIKLFSSLADVKDEGVIMEVNNNSALMLNIGTTMLKKTMESNEKAMATIVEGLQASAPPPPQRALDIYA